MGYVLIANTLVELLETISDLAVVYDHDPDELKEYPAATVQAGGHQNRFHDTAANDRSFSFIIRAYERLATGEGGAEDPTAEASLRSLADQIIAVLEANVTITGVWEIAQPTSAIFLKDKREVPVQIFELTVSIRSRVLR